MSGKAVIGLEIHVQLKTKTKMFCSCLNDMSSPANSNICPICLGLPGSLPVLNKAGLKQGLKLALALKCNINKESFFYRKHYFYPDLPKGYQITQSRTPLGTGGCILLNGGKKIRIRGIHIEEESGKLMHEGDKTLIDFNRAGIPLAEIVSEPDIETPEQAAEFVEKLQLILQYLDISNARMEKGELRCEPNISITEEDGKLGTRCEIKNLNSIKNLRDGIRKEVSRQEKLIKEGKVIQQFTLLWDESTRDVKIMRKKETAADYRYMPEPDIPPLVVDDGFINSVKKDIGELPDERIDRFVKQGLSKEEAGIIVSNKKLADIFETTIDEGMEAKESYSWIQNVFLGALRMWKKEIDEIDIKDFIEIMKKYRRNLLTSTNAKIAIQRIVKGEALTDFVKELEISMSIDLNSIIEEVLNKYQEEVKRYKEGKKGLLGFFIGQVMKKTKGKINPNEAKEVLIKKLHT